MRLYSIIQVAYHIKRNRFREQTIARDHTAGDTHRFLKSLPIHLTVEILVMSEEWSR